jgi:hypothetical protein
MRSAKCMKLLTTALVLSMTVYSCSEKHNETVQSAQADSAASEKPVNASQGNAPAAEGKEIEVQTFLNTDAPGGYGYDITVSGKLYIHQPHIPAVSGNRSFISENDARKAGELVAGKLRNNIMPPGISLEELDSLGIK